MWCMGFLLVIALCYPGTENLYSTVWGEGGGIQFRNGKLNREEGRVMLVLH